ncbi:tetratricopeptide repeat protein [Nocardiopsis sp. CT-R113]|uniref:Tetratricopeptide repeat protein n=1 Tax=Nocardiopsis codii TaxID=3065942 RepID=A0ABU7K5R2_9ACTN|nr:trypsin-like serine protease [Nocardiopsis sp. CT-R113]MEE2037593.1 tetratricopeptide repeat protein [Nocardiopsis sp. CT-R113]
MDTAQRITRITTPTSAGSGYLIAPRLVLTSAHLVSNLGGQVHVHTATDHEPRTGRVVWRGTPTGHDDAALVHVTDPEWAEHAVTTRWGRLVTTTPDTPCEVWGFPDLVQRTGRAAETAQLTGTVTPGNHFVNHRHVMDLSAHPPRWLPHEIREQEQSGQRRSLWAGLSGSAMRCGNGELVVGVVAADLEHRDHAALEVVPAYVLHHDPAFRAVLTEHGVSLVLEPVEFAHLAHTPRAHHRPSPAALLEAHRQVVDFHGRDETMRTLLEWCQGAEPLTAAVVHGPGGQGKTRLAHELTTRLADPDPQGRRWATVWLRESATADELGPVKNATAPLLVVVDYAETRTAQLVRLLQLCDRPPGHAPVRLLLLVRTLGEWWDQVNTATGYLLADITEQLALPPLAPHTGERAQEYRTALGHLAHALPTARTPRPADWARVAAGLADPDLSGSEWETVLSVHMRALADLLDATQHSTAVTTDTAVEGRVLAHEIRYWDQTATAYGLGDADLAHPLRDVLALVFALAPAGVAEADELLGSATVLQGQTTARRHQIRHWISGLYPPDGERMWGHLQPDRLLEYFLGQRLQRDPDLFDPHLDTISTADAERLVTLYARAATHPALASVKGHLTALCTRHIHTLGPAVIDVATQVEHPGPLMEALEDSTADPDTSREVLGRLSDALPGSSQRLALWAERLTARIVEADRERTARDAGAHLPSLAISLNNQALRLSELGQPEQALQAITEAVGIHRTLAEQHPDTHLPGLALALNNHAVHLSGTGRAEQALDTITEAVQHYRTLARQSPDNHQPDLAMALNNHALHLSDMGQAEQALDTITEAVQHYRTLARQSPDTHLPDLAMALNNQATRLAKLGRPEPALQAITEAVQHYRTLAERRPDAHLADLAGSLNNQATRLAKLGRPEPALQAITEAVTIRRTLAEQHPDAHLPDLAASLNNHALHLSDTGRVEQALDTSTEAVQHYRTLARQSPDAHLPDLAMALNNQSTRFTALGRPEPALQAITEAVTIRRTLAEQRPDAYLSDLAASLNNHALRLSDLGRAEQALGIISEALQLRRALAGQRPDAHLPDLAMVLNNHATCLAKLRRTEQALQAITEAVTIRRTLAEQHPDAHLPDLAASLNNQAARLAKLGRTEQALQAVTEAVTIRRTLARQLPDAHLPGLAMSLNNQALRLSELGRTEQALATVTEDVRIRTALAEKRPDMYQGALEHSRRLLETLKSRRT